LRIICFLHRITVNYLRHELTGYEAVLGSLRGLIGRAEASQLIRGRILAAIAEAYPWLAGECRRQKTEQRALHADLLQPDGKAGYPRPR